MMLNENDSYDLTSTCALIVSQNSALMKNMTDTSLKTIWSTKGNSSIEISSKKELGSLYIEWETLPSSWAVSIYNNIANLNSTSNIDSNSSSINNNINNNTDNSINNSANNSTSNDVNKNSNNNDNSLWSEEKVYGQSGFVNEYVKLPPNNGNIRISIKSDSGSASIARLRIFSKGNPPPGIQNWDEPLKKADMLLISTHADDEFLYFGGIIPTYAGDRGKKVQIAYLINHELLRDRELLSGLWICGVRNYPVFSKLKDIYAPNYAAALKVYSSDVVLDYQTGLIRRFKPNVVVGHDLNGEYGHGAHILNARNLTQSIILANKHGAYPASEEKYGLWEIKKCYLHLYATNQIIMDWTKPLENFSGKTAWEMAILGYGQHFSQHKFKFRVRIEGPYDCRKFGLYYTTVGLDINKDDLFENVANSINSTSISDSGSMQSATSQINGSGNSSSIYSSNFSEINSDVKSSSLKPNENNKTSAIVFASAGFSLAIILGIFLISKRRKH